MTVSWGFEKYFAFIYIHWSCKSISKRFEQFSKFINWFNCCRFHMRPEVESQHVFFLPHPISLGILPICIDLGLVHLDIWIGGFQLSFFYLYHHSLQQPWFLGRLKPGGNHAFLLAIQDLKLILKSRINL